jgi:hypothetical protein
MSSQKSIFSFFSKKPSEEDNTTVKKEVAPAKTSGVAPTSDAAKRRKTESGPRRSTSDFGDDDDDDADNAGVAVDDNDEDNADDGTKTDAWQIEKRDRLEQAKKQKTKDEKSQLKFSFLQNPRCGCCARDLQLSLRAV